MLTSFAIAALLLCGACASDSEMAIKPESLVSEAHPANEQMQAVLNQMQVMDAQPIERLTPIEARNQPSASDAVIQLLQSKGDPAPEQLPAVGRVEMKSIAAAKGQMIPVRVYTPSGDGPFPVIVYLHGGGWVIATLDTYDPSCRVLCALTKAVVVSVDYRKAPEYRFPAAHEDCYAALQFVMENTAAFNGNPSAVAVVGESAGGNMATAVCLMASQRGGHMPIHQVLIYPVTNCDFNTPSYIANATAKPLNAAMMEWFFSKYLNGPSDAGNVLISPLRASSDQLRALPPATVVTDEIDPLRSEGIAYAQKLRDAGVNVAQQDYVGVTHEFFGMGLVIDQAKAAEAFVASRLNDAFKAAH